MFYEKLYPELGKLFYYIASVDGKVQPAERESLEKVIKNTWEPLEDSVDEFGTDQSVLITSAFDYEDSEGSKGDDFNSFEAFYKANKAGFTPVITKNILKTTKEIANSFHGKNKDEKAALQRIENLFNTK